MDRREAGGAPPPDAGMEEPVLILTPTGRDAAVVEACLHAAGIRTSRCHDVAAFCAAMDTAAAGLLADEALPALALDVLRPALERQPVWSDFPLLLLTSSARARRPCGSACRAWALWGTSRCWSARSPR